MNKNFAKNGNGWNAKSFKRLKPRRAKKSKPSLQRWKKEDGPFSRPTRDRRWYCQIRPLKIPLSAKEPTGSICAISLRAKVFPLVRGT